MLTHGHIVTLDERSRIVDSLFVEGDRIARLGTEADLRPGLPAGTREINLGGRTVVPGLIDSHIDAIRAGLTFAGGVVTHEAHRAAAKGGIEFWPALRPEDGEEIDPWAPVDAIQKESPVARLARQVADRIARWLKDGARLPDHDAPIRPRDIMILLPRREPFGRELNAAAHATRLFLDSTLADAGISLANWRVLAALCEHGPQIQRDLARLVGMIGPSLVTRVDQLESLGLARRSAVPEDRRAFRVAPTTDGEAMYARVASVMRATEASLLDGLPSADVEAARRVLTHLVDRATALRERHNP